MSDSKLFARAKASDLRDELRNAGDKKDKGMARKKAALKKVIANMTMGNDSAWKCVWWRADNSVRAVPRHGAGDADPGARDQEE
jgi:hypothetical protein